MMMAEFLTPIVYGIFKDVRKWAQEREQKEEVLEGYRWAMILELRVALNILPLAIKEAENDNRRGMCQLLESIALPLTTACAMAMHGTSRDLTFLRELIPGESEKTDTANAEPREQLQTSSLDSLSRTVARMSTVKALAAADQAGRDVRWKLRLERLRTEMLETLRSLLDDAQTG